MAESWVVGLQASPLREDALVALVTAVASDDQVPPDRLFDAFDTASARETAAFGAISQLIRNREDAARVLLERRLTDPDTSACLRE
jgi:hypothetical protein